MTRQQDSATHTCKCGHRFRTLADEYGDHPCPKCGYHPSNAKLESDVSAYVTYCRDKGYTPDAFAFSLTYQRTHGRTPGEIIAQLIDKELAEYGVN